MKTPAATLLLLLVLMAGSPARGQALNPAKADSAPASGHPTAASISADEADRAWAAVIALRPAAGPAATSSAAAAPATSALASSVAPGPSGPLPPVTSGATAAVPGPAATSIPESGAVSAPVAASVAVPASVPFTRSAAAMAEAQARAVARVQSARQTAAAAKAFYTRFPAHAQAPDARKLEALSGLAGITAADQPHEAAALKAAGEFRANRAHPIVDRYEVAHAVERQVIGRKLGGKSWLSSPFESEAMADRLRGEFGHLPQVDANYLAVAQYTPCDHSREVAQRILGMPVSPSIKAAAQRLVDRGNLIGRPLDFPLTPAAGPPTRLAALAGSTPGVRTLVVFWDAVRSPAGPPGLHPFVQKAPPNTQWVYVALGAWRPPTKASPGNANASAAAANAAARAGPPAIRASAAPPGTYCVEPLGLRSTVAAQLKLSSLPFVCVVDDRKRLNAFGRIDEIPALLAGINRLLEQ